MQFSSFHDFYPFYLSEHSDRRCRRAHFIGSCLVLLVLLLTLLTLDPWLLILVPLIGYGFAWFGHMRFEKNRPATFSHPLYSLMGDWVMFWQMLRGRIRY